MYSKSLRRPLAVPGKRRLARIAAAGAATIICAPGVAQAQAAAKDAPQLEEVVVTAQKREQRLQDVPVAVTAITAEAMASNGVKTVRDLSSLVPNLIVNSQVGGQSLPRYTMRGITALGSATGSDKGIAVYVDGVFMGTNYGSIFELADIERIEVLRGPQGTLFGRNSTAGAISIVTPEPAGQFGVKQSFTVGNYDQLRSVTRLNTPQMGPLSAVFTYAHTERRGDIRNTKGGTRWDYTQANGGKPTFYTSPKYLGGSNTDALSGAVKFTPNDRLKFIYRFDYTDTDYTANALGTTYLAQSIRNLYASQPDQSLLTPVTQKRPKAVNNGDVVPGHLVVWGHSLTMQYEISPAVTLKNILAYRHMKFIAPSNELTGIGVLTNTGTAAFQTFLGAATANATIGAPVVVRTSVTKGSDRQWSDELQLNIDTSRVTLTSGALYFFEAPSRGYCCEFAGIGQARSGASAVYPGFALPYAGQPQFTRGRPTTVKVMSYAAYSQGELHLTPQLDVIAGIRYTKDRKKGIDFNQVSGISQLNFVLDYEGHRTTFNLGVNYKPTSDVLVYGKYSTGYISGGALAGIEYNPETAKSWEAGIKADWRAIGLRTNLAVFDVKYGNVQFAASGASLVPPQPQVTQFLANAGDGKAKGFELETTWAPVRAVTLGASVGYTDFKFTRLDSFITAGQAQYFAQYRPKWTANLSAAYNSDPVFGDANITARIDANYQSKSTLLAGLAASFTPTESAIYQAAAVIPSHWIVNSRVALQGFKVAGADASLGLWARNLLNNKDVNFGVSVVTAIAVDYERARTVGVDLNLEF